MTLYVVSGLPRSGTSMMMQMLEAGGVPVLIDGNIPTDDNPGGRYEYTRAMKLWTRETSWIGDANKKAVKVLLGLIIFLPPEYQYKIILMRRTAEEISASSIKMFGGVADTKEIEQKIRGVTRYINRQSNMELQEISYNETIYDPRKTAISIVNFLGEKLDTDAMSKIPNSMYYRNRKNA